MSQEVEKELQEIFDIRRQARSRLAQLTDEELEYPVEIYGQKRNIRWMLYQIGRHELEHITHIRKIRQSLGREQRSEAQLILAQDEAIRGQLVGALLGLEAADLARSPGEGEWSLKQVLDHAKETELRYLGLIEKALSDARSASA